MVYMIRQFSFDLIEHIARKRDPARAVPLSPPDPPRARHRQCHGPRHGALPGRPSHAVQQLDPGARAGAGAGARRGIGDARSGRRASARCWTVPSPMCGNGIPMTSGQTRAHRPAARGAGGAPRAGQALSSQAPTPGIGWWREIEAERSLECSELLNSLVIELYPELVDDLEARHGLAGARPGRSRHEPRRAQGPDRDPLWLGARRRLRGSPPAPSLLVPLGGEGRAAPGRALQRAGGGAGAAARHRADGGRPASRAGGPARGRACAAASANSCSQQPRWRGILRRIQSLARCPMPRSATISWARPACPSISCAASSRSSAPPNSIRNPTAGPASPSIQGAPVIEELADPQADDWAFPSFPILSSPSPPDRGERAGVSAGSQQQIRLREIRGWPTSPCASRNSRSIAWCSAPSKAPARLMASIATAPRRWPGSNPAACRACAFCRKICRFSKAASRGWR